MSTRFASIVCVPFLLLAAAALVYLVRARPQVIEKRITQHVHLSGLQVPHARGAIVTGTR